MATGPGLPSGQNTFVPSFSSSGRLAVAYSRNPKTFPLMQFAQLIESDKMVGYFLRLSAQEAARVVTSGEYSWPIGQPRPIHADGTEQFNYVSFITQRKDYGFTLGDEMAQQADWAILEQHSEIHCQKAMTDRTIMSYNVLTNTSNWTTASSGDYDLSADHTATAATFVGGFLDQGTSTKPFIKIFIDKVVTFINLETIGVVQQDQMSMILNSNTARLLSESSEIHEYLKGSPAAMEEIRTGSSPNARYGMGLPTTLYGLRIVVDNAVKVTSRKGATLAKSFAMPDQQILIASRIGELEGKLGPNFSTFCIFFYKDEMTLERFDDPKNRLVEGHVVQNISPQIVSPLSGYLLTAATSVAS